MNADVDEEKRIKEIIQKELLELVVASKVEIKGYQECLDALGLDSHKDEVWSMLDGDFEFVQLRENPTRLMKIGVELPLEVRTTMVECL